MDMDMDGYPINISLILEKHGSHCTVQYERRHPTLFAAFS
jgi:hypothetical protein